VLSEPSSPLLSEQCPPDQRRRDWTHGSGFDTGWTDPRRVTSGRVSTRGSIPWSARRHDGSRTPPALVTPERPPVRGRKLAVGIISVRLDRSASGSEGRACSPRGLRTVGGFPRRMPAKRWNTASRTARSTPPIGARRDWPSALAPKTSSGGGTTARSRSGPPGGACSRRLRRVRYGVVAATAPGDIDDGARLESHFRRAARGRYGGGSVICPPDDVPAERIERPVPGYRNQQVGRQTRD